MDAALKQEWVERLLSDDYHQGIGGLRAVRDGVAYNDAWGVLMDILVESRTITCMIHQDADPSGTEIYYYGEQWFTKYPSYDLMGAIGIPWNCGPSADIRNYVSGLNDSGSNFIYIAGEIQEYVPTE